MVHMYIYMYVCYMCVHICISSMYIYACMCVDIIAHVGGFMCSGDTVILVHVYIHNNKCIYVLLR